MTITSASATLAAKIVQPGESIKVHLPGEWPWATVVSKTKDGRVAARLDNTPIFTERHGYRFGDMVTFERDPTDAFWELAPLDRQLPALVAT